MPKSIFLVDDEPLVLSSMSRCLRQLDAEVHTFESPIKAIEKALELVPKVIVTDQRMPIMTGTEMISDLRDKGFEGQVILVSGHNDFNDVANAFNQGFIQKYLAKPWDNQELRDVITNALNLSDLIEKETEAPKSNDNTFHGIVSKHPLMEKTFNYIRKASTANVPVFISGETGTGKELAAKAFHTEGMRKDKPFVAVNCANFSETLMESQLFGHIKGAFTGAVSNQAGLLESSADGVLFLDEITCLPLPLQAKMLRVLQEREFSPIGSQTNKKFLAQVVSASSTPLQQAVEQGEFREDLFYRLNVISVGLPPLRERGEDVVLLAKYFLKRFNQEINKGIQGFTPEAIDKLLKYHWPGNIRQLQNLLHAVIVLNDGPLIEADMIDVDIKCDLSKPAIIESKSERQDNKGISAREVKPLWKSEKESIEAAIQTFDGNIPKAAAALEVSPSTLYRKIQSWKST